MSNAPLSALRIVALVFIALIAGLDALLSIFGGIRSVTSAFTGNWTGQLGLITPEYPFIDSWAEIDKEGEAVYAGVIISSDEPLTVPRALQATALALGSLIRILGGTLVVLIAARIIARKSVSGLARWGVVALGILIAVTAVVGPQLQVLSANLAIEQLDYPVATWDQANGATEDTFPEGLTAGSLGIWALGPTDGLLMIAGVLIAVLGFMFAHGLRLTPPSASLAPETPPAIPTDTPTPAASDGNP